MAILQILQYPDERLHRVAKPVARVDARLQRFIDDLAETMYDAPGVGLAATQVDVHERIITIDISETRRDLLVLINPQIVFASGSAEREEGCLSVPGIYEKLERAEHITVEALDRDGKLFRRDTEGLLSVCIQHEMDHLQGKVFVEYLSRLKQNRIRSKLKKRTRLTA